MADTTIRLPQKVKLELDDMGRLSCRFNRDLPRMFPDRVWTAAREGEAVIMEVTSYHDGKYGFINGYMKEDGPEAFTQAPFKPDFEAMYKPTLPALAEVRKDYTGNLFFVFPGNRQQFQLGPEWLNARIGPAVITRIYKTDGEPCGYGIPVPMSAPDVKAFLDHATAERNASRYLGKYFFKVVHPVLGDMLAYGSSPTWKTTGDGDASYAMAWTDPESGETAYQTLPMGKRIASECWTVGAAQLADKYLISPATDKFLSEYPDIAPKFLDKYPRSRLQWEPDHEQRFSAVLEDAICDEIFKVTRPVNVGNAKNLPFIWLVKENTYRFSAYTEAETREIFAEIAAINKKTDETLDNYLKACILSVD